MRQFYDQVREDILVDNRKNSPPLSHTDETSFCPSQNNNNSHNNDKKKRLLCEATGVVAFSFVLNSSTSHTGQH